MDSLSKSLDGFVLQLAILLVRYFPNFDFKPVVLISGLVLLDVTIMDLLITVLEMAQPGSQHHSLALKCVILTPLLILSGFIYFADVTRDANKFMVAIHVFCRLTGELAISSICVFGCYRLAEPINFLKINYSWVIHLAIMMLAFKTYKFPRNGEELFTCILIFVIQSQVFDFTIYCWQFCSVYVDWLLVQIYRHPPLALPIVYISLLIRMGYGCVIGIIQGIGTVINLDIILLIIGSLRMLYASVILLMSFLSDEASWFGIELGFIVLVAIVAMICITCFSPDNTFTTRNLRSHFHGSSVPGHATTNSDSFSFADYIPDSWTSRSSNSSRTRLRV